MEGSKTVVSVLSHFNIKKYIKSLKVISRRSARDKTTGSFLIGSVGGVDIFSP